MRRSARLSPGISTGSDNTWPQRWRSRTMTGHEQPLPKCSADCCPTGGHSANSEVYTTGLRLSVALGRTAKAARESHVLRLLWGWLRVSAEPAQITAIGAPVATRPAVN